MEVNKEFNHNLQSIKAEHTLPFDLKDLTRKNALWLYLARIQSQNLEPSPDPLEVSLRLYGVTNEDLLELSRFNFIKPLRLSYSSVTDAGMTALAKLTNLQKLVLSTTKVTREDRPALHAHLPNLRILP